MKRRQQTSGKGGGGGARKRPVDHGSNKHKVRSSPPRESDTLRWRKIVLLLMGVSLLFLAVYAVLPSDFIESSQEERDVSKRRESEEVEEGEEDVGDLFGEDGAFSCERLMAEAKDILSKEPRNQWETALDLLASCALQEPENPKPRWNLAVALIQMERPDEALAFIDEALAMDHTNLDYLKSGGAFFSRMGFHEQTIQCLERFLELSLHVDSWDELLASISIQREDEWLFLYEADDNVTQIFELLLHSYLQQKLLIKASYMYKIVIGLRGPKVEPSLIYAYSLFSLGLGDLLNGVHYLRKYTENHYIMQGYGNEDQAYEVVSAHSLRLFTAGFDSHIISIVRNLLMVGQAVWDEVVFNCQLGDEDKEMEFSVSVSQEDVRKVLSKCILAQGIIPALLKDGAVVYAENMFGWTPLLHAAALGNPTVMDQLIQHKADPQVRTVLAHTSLHIAATRGSYDIVSPMIDHGLRPSEVDYFNRTALQVACMQRWSAKPMAEALQVPLPRGCPTELKYEPPPKHSFQGGWLTNGVRLPPALTDERCDFDVIPNSLDVMEFLFNYLALQRPVLIRGGGSGTEMKPLSAVLLRNKLEQEFGNLNIREIPLPFAEVFGYPAHQTTIKSYLDKIKEFSSQYKGLDYRDVKAPHFVYEPLPKGHPLLQKFKIPAIFSPNQTHIALTDLFLTLGPALSGTPPHFHRSSWHMLVYGQTRWFLYPPPQAMYTKTTAWDWWLKREREGDKALECVQYPGDILVIPDMWGQASINLRECISIVSEFLYGASEFSI